MRKYFYTELSLWLTLTSSVRASVWTDVYTVARKDYLGRQKEVYEANSKVTHMCVAPGVGEVVHHTVLRHTEIRSNAERDGETNVGQNRDLPSDFPQEEAVLKGTT